MQWDYIIIGAGSAGCALTYELVNAGKSVLVIEAGGDDRSPSIRVAAAQGRACAAHDWGYRSEPDPTRNGASEAWLRGRVLGGSSSINGTMYVRGAPFDFDRWNLPGWSANDVLPLFRALEKSDQPGPFRGHEGPLHVRTVKRPHPIARAFIESAMTAGHAFNEDYNAGSQEGVAYAQLSQRGGWRCSAADAFLKPLLSRKNLTLWLDAMVEKIEIANGRAVAVHFSRRGRKRRESAGDIILCAGAINSPKLLMLSGIGPAEELRRHALPVVIDSPGVGANLIEQPLLFLNYRSLVPTYNLTGGITQKLQVAAKFILNGEGPISNLFEAAAFLKSSAAEPHPDIQLIFLSFGYVKEPNGRLALASYPAVLVLVIESYPRSRGRITLASSNPLDPPVIGCRLLEDEADVRTLARGITEVRRIMGSLPIAQLLDQEITPGADVHGEQALHAFIRNNTGISFHPIGTCRMGLDNQAVVGADLRVRGIENLWVADASVMPEHISANINAACMMIGMKLGRQLVGERRSMQADAPAAVRQAS